MNRKVTKAQYAEGMDCIVVGGCANGVILHKIRMDAQWIELKRPDYIKPLPSAFATMPEVMHESDKYEIHAIQLVNSETNSPAIFAIGVVDGMSLTDAFSELCKSHVEGVTQRLMHAGLVNKQ
jgi:hypothetical protein